MRGQILCEVFKRLWRQISLLGGAFPSFQQNCPFTLPRKPSVRSYNSQKISNKMRFSNAYSIHPAARPAITNLGKHL